MPRSLLSGLALSFLVSAAACDPGELSAPPRNGTDGSLPLPSLPASHATLSCSYSPSGTVGISVGQSKTFTPSSVSDCDGAYGTLTPTDGRVGFGISSPCGVFEKQEGGGASLFKVRRCSTGTAEFKIYTNSSKTTLLQTISIVIEP